MILRYVPKTKTQIKRLLLISASILIALISLIETKKTTLKPTTETPGDQRPKLDYPILLDEYMKGLLNIYGIVPDVLPKPPTYAIKVEYTDDLEIEFSRVFFPRDLRRQPQFLEWRGPKNSYYTLLMIGLANPTMEDFNTYEWLHWMVGNIYGITSSPNNKTIAEYVAPEPVVNNGMYRYIFLVFVQPKKIEFPNKPPLRADPKDKRRANFSIAKFSKKYQLGAPMGINFFQSEFWHQNDSKTNFSIYDPTPGSYWMTDLEDYIGEDDDVIPGPIG